MRLKLTLEYDGSRFRGWAAQPSLRTVEGVVRDALGWVYDSWERLAVAGRTDTGVHAIGQVASVDVEGGPPVERAARALNTALPDDVSVIAAEEVAPDFHARHSARARSYRYRIWRRQTPSPFEQTRSYWYPHGLDYQALADCADLLIGEHDFRAFTPTETYHDVFTREVRSAAWFDRGDALELEITANSLPAPHGANPGRHDARASPGGARRSPGRRPARRSRHDRASHGLYLERVDY